MANPNPEVRPEEASSLDDDPDEVLDLDRELGYFVDDPFEEWERFFNEAGIPAGPVYAMDSALDHPQVRHREMVVSRPHPVLGEVSLLGLPVKLSETPGAVDRIPPELGEHTDILLREIGVSDDQLARLREQEII